MTRTAAEKRAGLRVLVAGGGVAGLETMLALRELAGDHVEIDIVSPERHFFYRPLAVAEPFGKEIVHRWELDDLARAAGASYLPGELVAVNAEAHLARLAHGPELDYGVLVLACGARPQVAVPGALTFRGSADVDRFERLLTDIEGGIRRIVFAVPSGPVWPLPLYELALLTSAAVRESGFEAELVLATAEHEPLGLFGPRASKVVARLLEQRGILLRSSVYPTEATAAGLNLLDNNPIEADRVVALPRLRGPQIDGVPHNDAGFVLTDGEGRVTGVEDAYAAGDITAFPLKQGGLAAEEADAVAERIAAQAGARVVPQPFRPFLRAVLLTGDAPLFLRTELSGDRGATSTATEEPLWWPPSKIFGRRLSSFLAELEAVDPAHVHELTRPS
jgi:sulfide:quinone oxidoreductase